MILKALQVIAVDKKKANPNSRESFFWEAETTAARFILQHLRGGKKPPRLLYNTNALGSRSNRALIQDTSVLTLKKFLKKKKNQNKVYTDPSVLP